MFMFRDRKIKAIDDLPFSEKLYGFIYIVQNNINGKKYIGKKNFYSTKIKKFGKKKIASMKDKRLKKYETITSESNWKDYWGSTKKNEEFKKDFEKYGTKNFSRYIIDLATCKKELGYLEIFYQFKYDVLKNNDYYNGNIAGKWYRKDIELWNLQHLK